MAYVDANGKLTSTPPPGAKAATKPARSKRSLQAMGWIDPNDHSKGYHYRPINFKTSSIATIGADGKLTTQCVDADGNPAAEVHTHQEASH